MEAGVPITTLPSFFNELWYGNRSAFKPPQPSLAEFGITDGSMLHLLLRLSGGHPGAGSEGSVCNGAHDGGSGGGGDGGSGSGICNIDKMAEDDELECTLMRAAPTDKVDYEATEWMVAQNEFEQIADAYIAWCKVVCVTTLEHHAHSLYLPHSEAH